MMAPLLPRIHTGEGNMGWEYGGRSRGVSLLFEKLTKLCLIFAAKLSRIVSYDIGIFYFTFLSTLDEVSWRVLELEISVILGPITLIIFAN